MKIVPAAVLAVLVLLSAAAPTRAQDPVDGVQRVISLQIEAFLHDDARAAYAFASPAIRQKFPDEAAFFEMIKRGYAPVYRPGNFAFGRNKVSGGTIVQEVIIKGQDGKNWTALYQVVRQPDGDYRINGVHMMAAAAGSDL